MVSGLKNGVQRQSHTKVKSGCITWIRRVKCDETKPSCLKCTSTGRKCDGYKGKGPTKFFNTTVRIGEILSPDTFAKLNIFTKASSGQNLSRLIGSPHNPLLDFTGSALEHRSLGFFLYGAAPALSGYFDTDFWNGLLPRIASSEPPVQHAMIALASLYEQSAGSDDYPSSLQQRYALIQYNKAIRSLKGRRVDDARTLEVTLLTCVLFVCLELLRGNQEQALDHLQSGLSILNNWKKEKGIEHLFDFSQMVAPTQPISTPQSIEEVLTETFSRLSIQASLCGRRLPDLYPTANDNIPIEDPSLPATPFSTLAAARLSLKSLFIQSLRPSNPETSKLQAPLHPSASQIAERQFLVAQLHHWNARLALHITDNLPNLCADAISGSRVLRILSIIAIIWNSTTLSETESSFDSHFESYKTLIALATSLVSESSSSPPAASPTTASTTTITATPTLSPSTSTFPLSSPASGIPLALASHPPSSFPAYLPFPNPSQTNQRAPPTPTFTFEMGIIPALYFTALKCRSPKLRRRAIALLKAARPQREGLWDARVLRMIAERCVAVEEDVGGQAGEVEGRIGEAGKARETEEEAEAWPAEERRIHGVFISPGHDLMERWQEVWFTWRPGGAEAQWEGWGERIYY